MPDVHASGSAFLFVMSTLCFQDDLALVFSDLEEAGMLLQLNVDLVTSDDDLAACSTWLASPVPGCPTIPKSTSAPNNTLLCEIWDPDAPVAARPAESSPGLLSLLKHKRKTHRAHAAHATRKKERIHDASSTVSTDDVPACIVNAGQLSEAKRALQALATIRDELGPTGNDDFTLLVAALSPGGIAAPLELNPFVTAVKRITHEARVTAKYTLRKLTSALLQTYTRLEGLPTRRAFVAVCLGLDLLDDRLNERDMHIKDAALLLSMLMRRYPATIRIPSVLTKH